MDNKLKNMLKDLISCIEGDYIVADGALLGITREGGLLKDDDDIDLYILPNTKINWDKLPININIIKIIYVIKYTMDKIKSLVVMSGYAIFHISERCLSIMDSIVLNLQKQSPLTIKEKKSIVNILVVGLIFLSWFMIKHINYIESQHIGMEQSSTLPPMNARGHTTIH